MRCLIILAGILAFHVVPAASKTLTVGKTGLLASIEQAVRVADRGDIVRISPGIYTGNIILNKPLLLEGIGRPVLRGNGRGSVITILADGCTIRGFVIEHSGPMLVDEDSGILLKSDHNRIEGNELRDVLFGIYFYQANDNTVSHNVISGRHYLEMGERGSGIHIWNSLRNTIRENRISRMRDGMYLQNAGSSFISGNKVYDLRYGLHYMFSDDNRFENNDFFNNIAGAAIMYSHNIVFRKNAFVRNRGFSSYGILFQDSHNCLAEENTISDNGTGIFMEALTDTVFRHNTIASNDIAIQAFSSATGDTFTANNFIANLSPLQLIGKVTDIRWNEGNTGNYWSEYDGYDLNGDGRGDIDFKIQNAFEHLEGNFPRLRIYLLSPASAALGAAERMFPILEPPRTADRFPLMRPVELPVREPQVIHSKKAVSVVICLLLMVFGISVFAWGKISWSK